jgi:ATP phosphoribosyltransferase
VAEHDVLQPPTATTGVEEIMDLGFGRCKLQVQVPEKGSIENPDQLVGKNVVTSFANLSKKFFTELEATADGKNVVNGMSQKPLRTNIKYIGGSVEAACALGIADGIVDLVGKNCLLAVAE